MIYFVCPQSTSPTGGVRKIYQCVDTLNSHGISARVVHRDAEFRCDWFSNDTPIVSLDSVRFERGDLLVLPEIYSEFICEIAPGVPHAVLNQNQFYTFHTSSISPDSWRAVHCDDTLGMIAVSQYGVDYLRYCFPTVPVHRLDYGVDSKVFFPPAVKKDKKISFMPRKRFDDLRQIFRILDLRGALDGWTLNPIDAMSETQVAENLRSSAIFLSMNDIEGFGIPPIEAMASGCLVVGYDGVGGREYMNRSVSIPIDSDDVYAFACAMEKVLNGWGKDQEIDEKITQGIQLVAHEYSKEREEQDIIRIFSELSELAKDREPRSTSFVKTDL